MARTSVGSYGHIGGLYVVTVWQVGLRWRRRFTFTCDVCDLESCRLRVSDAAWARAREHTILHDGSGRDVLRKPAILLAAFVREAGGDLFVSTRSLAEADADEVVREECLDGSGANFRLRPRALR